MKEIFYTLQGEGVNAGRAAVFCRFSGCNLWSGREADRASAVCTFCDTDFVGVDGIGGGKFSTATDLASEIASYWPVSDAGRRFVVCTGGEPLLQLNDELIEALHERNFEIAIETNGTLPVPSGVDWVCVSPKSGAVLAVTGGDELKVIYPQYLSPLELQHLAFKHYFVQPMDGPNAKEAMEQSIQFCSEHPVWRLSLQTHKLIGIR